MEAKDAKQVTQVSDDNHDLCKTTFNVLDIYCLSEVPLIERVIQPLNGVERVSVNLPRRTVIVPHD